MSAADDSMLTDDIIDQAVSLVHAPKRQGRIQDMRIPATDAGPRQSRTKRSPVELHKPPKRKYDEQPEETQETQEQPNDGFSAYDREKMSLISLEQEIKKKVLEDKDGRIVRFFGASQLNLSNTQERPIGVVVLRTLLSPNRNMVQSLDGQTVSKSERSYEESVVDSMYELWGFFDPKDLSKIGLLVSFKPENIVCIINLKSGLDVPD
jgi:hypothetical protein